jgi:hypothetical protein
MVRVLSVQVGQRALLITSIYICIKTETYRARHANEARMAKKEAKKDNHLISHSLTTEFAGKTDSEKRELVNMTLQKLRAAHESSVQQQPQVSSFLTF